MVDAGVLSRRHPAGLLFGMQTCHNPSTSFGESDGACVGGAATQDSNSGAYPRMAASSDDLTRVIPADQRTAGTMPLVLPEITGAAEDDGADNTTLPVGTRLFEFEITGLIGIGGFGIVYAAYDQSLHRAVAIKEYMPGSLATRSRGYTVVVRSQRDKDTFEVGRRSFVNEARLLAQFDHPSLVKVFRFWEANGTAYMVMPLYKGVTLKQRLKEMTAPPGEAWMAGLLRQLIEALEVIHAESCFHRDIAPDNILLVEGDRPVLLDFGAARRVISDMTQTLTVILKPGYAPIEQYAENPSMRQGPWTDVYALAAVVYFALTGAPPDPAVSRMMKDTVRPLAGSARSGYSEGFLKVIDTALSLRPEDRPQSVAAFWALLDSHLSAATVVPARTVTEPARVSGDAAAALPEGGKTPARSSLPLIAGAVMALAVAIGAGVFFYRSGVEPPPVELPRIGTSEPVATPDQAQPAEPTPAPPADRVPVAVSPPAVVAEPVAVAPPQPEPREVTHAGEASPAPKTAVAEAKRAPSRAERLQESLTNAEQAISRGQWRRAEQFADRALELDAGNARAVAIKQRAQAEEKKAAFDAIKIE
jgi:serine/threonine protein kinase